MAIYAPEIRRQGFEIRVLVLEVKDGNPEARRLSDAGIAVDFVPIDRLKRLDQMAALLRYVRKLAPGVIHAHLESAIIAGGLARRVLGIPSVATLHTLLHPTGLSRGSARLWLMHKTLIHGYDRVICLSHAAEAFARSHGLARAPLTMLHNGIDLAPFSRPPTREARTAGRAALGLPADAPVIAAVSVLRREKGIHRLIEAMAAIRQALPEARLLVVGDGDEMDALRDQAAAAGLGGAILFTGYREDVAELLALADLFAHPTVFDALPTVVIEAMAAGLPVVASRVGGVPDMVRDGIEGRLVPPDDAPALAEAIIALLADSEARAVASRAARTRAWETFSLEGQVAELGEIYDALIAQGRAAG